MKSILVSLFLVFSSSAFAAEIVDGVYECESGSIVDETDEAGEVISSSIGFKIEINPDHLVIFDEDTGALEDVLMFTTNPKTSEVDDEFGKEIEVANITRKVDQISIDFNTKNFDKDGVLTTEEKALTVMTGLANNRIYVESTSEYTEIDGKSSSTESDDLTYYCKLVK